MLASADPDKQPTPDVASVIAQLGDSTQSWSAAARLQRLGEKATKALIGHLRQDPFSDRHHGNHSTTMKVLEKIGEPALPALSEALNEPLLHSQQPEDIQYVLSIVMVLGKINRTKAVPDLVHVAHDAADSQLKRMALQEIVGQETYMARIFMGDPWRSPFPISELGESAKFASALVPLLPKIHTILTGTTDANLRLPAAYILARWGSGELKAAGERYLITLATDAEPYYRQEAVRLLGALKTTAAVDVLKQQLSKADDQQRLSVAEALFEFRDPAYVTSTSALMESSDEQVRRRAIALARASRNAAFVPALIGRLQDTGWNGSTTTQTRGEERHEIRHALGEDALAALRHLTFVSLDADPDAWRTWWAANSGKSYEALLGDFAHSCLAQLDGTEPHVMNQWIEALEEVESPTILPLLRAYLAHPRLSVSQVGPNSWRGGGGPSTVITLLLRLVQQGDDEAKALLQRCLQAEDYQLREYAALAIATFDQRAAVDHLVKELDNADSAVQQMMADRLLQLGDARAMPNLIARLDATDQTTRSVTCWALHQYTQEDLPCDPTVDAEQWQTTVQRWRVWWHENQATFQVQVKAAQIDREHFK